MDPHEFIQQRLSILGFTLLELLTTLAIGSLLVTISYPFYTHHILKTNRAQAKITLLHVAAALEHFHAMHHTYQGANLDNIAISDYAYNKAYLLKINDLKENSYTVSAIPQGAQIKDTLCGILSLNALGKKSMTGTGKLQDCW